MTNEEIIAKARTAKSAEDILDSAAQCGVKDMTLEEAEKIYKRFHTSGELSDEEFDVSAGGCADASYDNTCPQCGVGTLSQSSFMVRDSFNGTRTTTLECDNCHYTKEIVYYEY